MTTPAILVEQVVKQYGKLTAVNDVSLTVAAGETLGLLGPNGAGKSTLIRMLTTLVPITSGRIVLHGDDVTRNPDKARLSIGFIPQAMTSDTDLSVEENLSIYAKLYGVPRDVRRRVIPELLELVNLADRRQSLVGTLSGGMRRRVEIARGLVHSPQILVLDEPTTGLDPVSRADVWEMLTRIKAERQLTILVTTHYMDEADRLCDRIAIIDRGTLVALDTPRALKAMVPGASAIEAQFSEIPLDWATQLSALDGTTSVQSLGGSAWRIVSDDAGRTTMALTQLSLGAGAVIRSLSVASTTLDDVFVHFTGHGLRDEHAATRRPTAA
ncbi:MAG TPA: ABC transporter ATP-binding protein [Gemmatimonadaceae bacterium]